MDLKDFIMLQMTQQTKNTENPILGLLLPFVVMFIMPIIDTAINYLKKLVQDYSKKVEKTVIQKKTILTDAIKMEQQHEITCLDYIRDFTTHTEMNEICDALLHYITKLHNIPLMKLIHTGKYITTFEDNSIQIKENIFFKIKNIVYDKDVLARIDAIFFSILGQDISIIDLQNWVGEIHLDYKNSLQTQFDTNLYFFDYKDPSIGGSIYNSNDFDKRKEYAEISNAPKCLSFEKTIFTTNKNFKSLYGEQTNRVYKSVNFFINNEQWYKERGLPYQLGMLFHGIPGCGKTACIKAIAKLTNRHIINVNFKYIKTMTQLKNLFFSEYLNVLSNDNEIVKVRVPIKKRLYVMEEIDAISAIVEQRTTAAKSKPTPKTNPTIVEHSDYDEVFYNTAFGSITPIQEQEQNVDIPDHPDKLTLGGILQILDGTLEVHSRMMIITSNFPENIDTALLRPGRIDLNIKFGKCDQKCKTEMFQNFFGIETSVPENLLNNEFTPAEFQQHLLEIFNDQFL